MHYTVSCIIAMISKWWQPLISYHHITPMLLPEHISNRKPQNTCSICLRTYVNYNYCPIGTSHAILHSILTLTAWSKHQLHRLRAQPDWPRFRCQAQIWGSPGHLHFWPIGHRFGEGVFHEPLRLNNFLKQPTELRKTLYLGLLFYYKGYKSGPVK